MDNLASCQEQERQESGVPHELLWCEIVPRLVLAEVLRLRCVCRRWRDIIFDPFFVKKHEQYNQGSNCSSYLITLNSSLPVALLNIHSKNPSWTKVDCLSRPGFALVGSCGGLLCYARSTYIDQKVSELDFVVCNPITGQSARLPTLHTRREPFTGVTYRPYVNMTMRQGRLHQLWVVHCMGIYIYDTNMSQQDWDEVLRHVDIKLASLQMDWDKMLILPNSWVDITAHTSFEPLLHWGSKMVFKSTEERLALIDTVDFKYTEPVWEDAPSREVFRTILEFKGRIAYALEERATKCYFTLGLVNFVTEDFGRFRVEPLVKFALPWSPGQWSLRFIGLGDMVYCTNRERPEKALICWATTDEDGRLCFLPPQEVEQPADSITRPLPFQPSLSDSPGREYGITCSSGYRQ